MRGQNFLPVIETYEARVIVGHLALAFNGGATEVPPVQSPLWPVACRLVESLRAGGYHLGSYYDEIHYSRSVKGPPEQPMNTVVPGALTRKVSRMPLPLPELEIELERESTG